MSLASIPRANDDNPGAEPAPAPFIELTRHSALGWDAALHRRRGFVCLIDGSVQSFTNGSAALAAASAALGPATNRLAVP